MIIAYPLGHLPALAEHSKEDEILPAGPRYTELQAQQLHLADGTLFCEATEEQVIAWFADLFERAEVGLSRLALILNGSEDGEDAVDLTQWEDRWWALNELVEISSVRHALAGTSPPTKPVQTATGSDLSQEALEALVAPYGLHIGIYKRVQANSETQVFAVRYREPRYKIYLCVLSVLRRGKLTREQVLTRIEQGIAAKQQPRKKEEERAA